MNKITSLFVNFYRSQQLYKKSTARKQWMQIVEIVFCLMCFYYIIQL